MGGLGLVTLTQNGEIRKIIDKQQYLQGSSI